MTGQDGRTNKTKSMSDQYPRILYDEGFSGQDAECMAEYMFAQIERFPDHKGFAFLRPRAMQDASFLDALRIAAREYSLNYTWCIRTEKIEWISCKRKDSTSVNK